MEVIDNFLEEDNLKDLQSYCLENVTKSSKTFVEEQNIGGSAFRSIYLAILRNYAKAAMNEGETRQLEGILWN